MLCNYKDTKNDGYIRQGFNKMIYLCGRVIWSNGKTQQTKEVRSFLYRYPLLYSSSSKIYYSIDYNHISCFSQNTTCHVRLNMNLKHRKHNRKYRNYLWQYTCLRLVILSVASNKQRSVGRFAQSLVSTVVNWSINYQNNKNENRIAWMPEYAAPWLQGKVRYDYKAETLFTKHRQNKIDFSGGSAVCRLPVSLYF